MQIASKRDARSYFSAKKTEIKRSRISISELIIRENQEGNWEISPKFSTSKT